MRAVAFNTSTRHLIVSHSLSENTHQLISFQPIDYQKNYSRNDGQQTQSSGASNKSGFSFIRALDTISHTNRAPAQSPSFFGGSSTSRSNEPPMSSSNRAFQVPRSVSSQTKLVPNSGFSFNRTLNQISSTGLQPNMLTVNDIDMDSSVFNRMQPSMTSQELKPNPFGFASSAGLSNNSGLFGNKRVITSPTTQTMATADPNFSQSSSVPKDNDIYSNASDLSDNDVNCFKCNNFSFKSIPINAPTYELCK